MTRTEIIVGVALGRPPRRQSIKYRRTNIHLAFAIRTGSVDAVDIRIGKGRIINSDLIHHTLEVPATVSSNAEAL